MNLTCSQASNLIEDYLMCKDILDKRLSKIFFVPSCYLYLAKEKFKYLDIKNNISYGAQNCSSFDNKYPLQQNFMHFVRFSVNP